MVVHSSSATESEPPNSNSSSSSSSNPKVLRPFRPLDALPPETSSSSSALFLSVSVGNSRMHWAFHAGPEQNFFPTVFWRSSIPSGESAETIGLESLIPQHLHPHFFGEPSSLPAQSAGQSSAPSGNRQRRTKKHQDESSSSAPAVARNNNAQALAHRTTLRVPMIYVYIVSTSPEHLNFIKNVFRGIPALLFQLSAEDLLSIRTSAVDSPVTIYKGIGVDRVANIVAAKLLFPQATAHMVIDGGTALTYTTVLAMESKNDTGEPPNQQPQQQMLAGGIGPGLAISCHALYDFTGDAPFVSYEQLVETVTRCETNQQPLPTLVPASSNESDDPNATTTTTTDSLLGCILQARALLLCNVVRGFLKANAKKNTVASATVQQLPVVLLTGGDAEVYGKLLLPHHSYLCESSGESNEQLLQSSIVEDDGIPSDGDASDAVPPGKTFRLCRVTHLFPQTVRGLLIQALQTLDEELAPTNTNEPEGTEWVRRQLLGQRIAILQHPSGSSGNNRQSSASRAKKQPVLGTIVSVIRDTNNNLNDDKFNIFYDDATVATDDLSVTQIYDGLVLFYEATQKTKGTDDPRGVRILNKAKDAKEAAELLAAKSTIVQLRQQEMSQAAVVQPKKRPAVAPPSGGPAAKKAGVVTSAASSKVPIEIPSKKRSPPPSAGPSERTAAPSPGPVASGVALVGRRVAKVFDEGIFFGTIREFLPVGSVEGVPNDLWSILYDDEDEEDLAHEDIKAMLALYEKEKKNDDAAT